MDPTLGYLRDIRGLDPIGWWPPAPGWWVLAATALLVLSTIVWWWRSGGQFGGSWRRDARRRLNRLRRELQIRDPKTIAGDLSALLRRIAVARGGRPATAGLVGEAWLDWLAGDDSTGFDWRTRGRVLLDAPYAPPDFQARRDELGILIDAALRWVATEEQSVRSKGKDLRRLWRERPWRSETRGAHV